MKTNLFSFTLTIILFVSSLCFNFSFAQESMGLNLEIEVVSRASLSISSTMQSSPTANNLRLSFGNVDAFGIHRSSGVFIEQTPLGMAYYQSIRINAGITGGKGNSQNLKVTLLRANPSSGFFFEEEGDKLTPGKTPVFLSAGQSKLIASRISGFQSIDRTLGIVVNPERSSGAFSAQILYSLEEGE